MRARVGYSRPKTATGIIRFFVHGSRSKAGALTPTRLDQMVRSGLAMRELDDLRASLDLPMDRLTPKLGISKATFHRRKATGWLRKEESDRVVRFARLMGKAVDVFGNELNARRWLTAPQYGLGGAAPLDFAETEVGAREVEDLLGRIEYGVYS